MEHRIKLELRGRNPEQVKVLNLDNCCSTTVVGITEEYCNLEVLSLINCNLTSLKGFPKLPKLRKLELSDNRISGGLGYLSINTQLGSLKLSGNKIKDFEAIEPLKQLSNLKSLDLYKCDISELDNYREKVFKILTNLEFLDGFDKTDKEADDSEIDDEANEDENEGEFESDDEDGENEGEEDDEEENDDDEENDDEENDEEEDGDEEVGLDYLEKEYIDEESEGNEYNPGGVEDDDEEEEEEDADTSNARGKKRKLEED